MNLVMNGGSVGNMNVMENNHYGCGMLPGMGLGIPPGWGRIWSKQPIFKS